MVAAETNVRNSSSFSIILYLAKTTQVSGATSYGMPFLWLQKSEKIVKEINTGRDRFGYGEHIIGEGRES